jgi:uncharacterized protein YjbJ (UPF0337 family)
LLLFLLPARRAALGLRRPARRFSLNLYSQQEFVMNSDTMAGKWKQLKGKVKETWGDLTDDDLKNVEGKRDQLIGRIQEKYGQSKDEIERKLKSYESDCGCA